MDQARHQEEDAKPRDEETRHYEEEAVRRPAQIELLLLKLTGVQVPQSLQPAQAGALALASRVEDGPPERQVTATVPEREETDNQAGPRGGDDADPAPGAARQLCQNALSSAHPSPAQRPRPEAEVDDGGPSKAKGTSWPRGAGRSPLPIVDHQNCRGPLTCWGTTQTHLSSTHSSNN